jgi:hypothetical protein
LAALHNRLGMPLSPKKSVGMAVHNPYLGVVTSLANYVSDGFFLFFLTVLYARS